MAQNNPFLQSPFDQIATQDDQEGLLPGQQPTTKQVPMPEVKQSRYEPVGDAGTPAKPTVTTAPGMRSALPTREDVIDMAQRNNVDPALALSIWSQESSGNWKIKDSYKGAAGGMQVMPDTFKSMMGSYDGLRDPWRNLEAGVKYLAYGQKTLNTKDPALLAAGYHSGYDRASLKRGEIPNVSDGTKNTRDYAREVARRAGQSVDVGPESAAAPKADSSAARYIPMSDDEVNQYQAPAAPDLSRFVPMSDDDTATYLKTMPAAKSDEPGFLDEYVVNPLKRGWGNLKQSAQATVTMADARQLGVMGRVDRGEKVPDQEDTVGYQYMNPEQRAEYKTLYAKNFQQGAQNIAAIGKEVAAIPQDPVVAAASNAKSFDEWWTHFKKAPIKFIANTGVESLPNMVPGLVLGAGAGVAANMAMKGGALAAGAAGMGAGSYAVDYPSTVMSALNDLGIDTNNPDALTKAFSDEKLMENVRKQAHAHAAVVGTLDAVSGGRAGATIVAGKTLARKGANLAAKTVEQGVLGGTGEAGGQIAQGKDQLEWGAIMGEFAGEMAGAPAEIAGAAYAKGKDAISARRAQQGTPPQAEPEAAQPAAPAAPASPVQPQAQPAPQPAPAPSGPLTTSVEAASEQNADQGARVTVTAPQGQMSGTLQGYQEDEQGNFVAQIQGDDGQVHMLTSNDGVVVEPEAPKNSGPMTAALSAAAEVHAENPAPAPAPSKPVKPDYDSMDLPQLRDRLKYIATQAKASGWDKRFMEARKEVERAINVKTKEVKEASKLSEEPMSSGPFDDRAPANKMALRMAEASGMPHEVIEAKGKFTIQPIKESNDAGSDATSARVRDDGVASVEASAPQRTGEPEGSQADQEPSRTGAPIPTDPVSSAGASVPGTDATANAKPALTTEPAAAPAAKDAHAGKWFGSQEKAAGYVAKKSIGKTHEVVQTGKVRFEVKPKAVVAVAEQPAPTAAVKPNKLEQGRERNPRQEEAVRQAEENIAKRKAEKGAAAEGMERFPAESGTLGIPRDEMPQIPTESHGGLVNHLNAQGIKHEIKTVPANDLKPTQAEFSPEGVERAKEATGNRAVIASNDGHIIDGHHQVLAAQEEGKDVKAIVLDAPIDQALEAVKNSPSAQAAGEVANEAPTTKPTPPTATKPNPFAGNKIFTSDAVEKARKRLKSKLSQLNSGIDPEVMMDGITIAGAYIESGVRKFSDYAKAMKEDLGEAITPYLLSFYEAARHYPGVDGDGMSSPASALAQHEAMMLAHAEVAKPEISPTMAPQEADKNATTLQSDDIPAGDQGRDTANAAAGDRDSEPVGARLAAGDLGTDQGGQVPGSAEEPGAAGARGSKRAGKQPSGKARDRAGERTEPVAAGRDEDHVIDAEDIGKGGLTKKYRDNVAAIRILKAMEAGDRVATPEERKQLAKYVGWGAMKGPFDPENKNWAKQHAELKELLTDAEFRAARKSTLDAHYTSPIAVGAMYDALSRLGFTGGRLLEPSVGIGNFFGLMPKDIRNASQLHGVELDSLTARMVAALYPKAKIGKAIGFEDFQIPSEYFDVVIGNPPFGSQPLTDAERSAYSGFSIHNYFLAKGIDKLRPGGIMEVVVSHNFLDAQDGRARAWIADRASLIGGVRLPNTAFKQHAGTDVVTDILVFQKHDRNGLPQNTAPWSDVVDQVNTNPKTGEEATHKVNQFFAQNPQFVLGKPSAGGSMYRANEYTVEANGDLKTQLAGWVNSLPENTFTGIDRKSDQATTDMAVPDGIKVGSYYTDATGKIMRRGEDVLGNRQASEWAPANDKAAARMKGLIGLRDSLRKQMRLERSLDATQAEIDANRTELNSLYDAFLKAHGHINSQTNRRLFLDDTESQLVQALEFDFDKGVSKATADKEGVDPREPSAVKADILARRVAFPPQDFMTVSTAKDALLASLNYRGKVDPAYMAEVYGKDMGKIVDELGDVVFDDPQAGIVTSDEYLAGDVKTKLAEAKAAAKDDAKYKRNVEALEKVIPVDKKPSEISASIGAAFIPADLYQQFVQHITGSKAVAHYIKATGQWMMSYTGQPDPVLNGSKFGTPHLSAQALFDLSMLGRGAVVKKTERHADGSTTTILMEKETEAAREKQNAIKAEWQSWLWGEPARAEQVAAIFNDKMNRIVDRKFDGSHMTFPGMNPAITLLEHQKNGVWRGLQSFQVLYDHVVGAGKTFEMATLAMEMRRLGIARKPVFVVPNHLTLQWRSEFTRLYPGSNILAATPEDFSKDNRERMFSKIITGDWDAVVIGHSSLKKIGLPAETEKAVLQEQIDEVAAAIEEMKRGRGDRNIIRDMEGIRARLEAKMRDKLAAIGKRSKVVTFDELGIDAMFVDEMHEFKNLAYNTTMDRNPGMGNPNGSAKAFDMFVKTRWLFDTFGEKTPFITATGTPVSNSLVEMFNMQRYMQYPILKREGLHVFDAWAKQFGSVENVYEVAPSGSGYRQSTRFAKFTNLPGLMGLYNSFADTVTLDDLKAQEEAQGKRFPVPKMVGGRPALVVANRSPLVAERMGVPKAELDKDGNIKFDLDLKGEISITKDEKSGKFIAKVGDTHLGQFETEQDARLKIVERAVSPKVTVDPKSILGRFENLRQLMKETKGKVNALSLTGEANKMGLDYRLVDPTAKDFPGSKINLAVGNMMKVYHQWKADRGAQLVFCDLSIPLSARASYSSKERRLYVRGAAGELEMKRGTMHTLEGQESLPYFIVQRGDKDARRFDVYDAASGIMITQDARTKLDAKEAASELLTDEKKREAWIVKREAAGEIAQETIDEYNNDNDVETEGFEFFTREDVAGVSGSAKFSVYDDIKAKLIAKGVPEREIAFIHDYQTPAAKDKLFKAVNSGEIRFLLGSTPKMGAGTNVQKRLVGLHHIDAPWRPSDLEQREGRIIRRGNELYARDPDGFEVFIGRYATEQTYDTRRWQILEHKARGIEQLRNFDGSINEIDDIEGEAANSADMKAAASGDPMILEETRLKNDVRRLEQLRMAHADDVLTTARRARQAKEYADERGPKRLAEINDLISTAKKHKLDKDGFAPITIDGKVFNDKESAAKEIASVSGLVRSKLRSESEISYRGLDFGFELGMTGALRAEAPTGNIGIWGDIEAISPTGFIQRMANYIDRLPAIAQEVQGDIAKAAIDADGLAAEPNKPFPQAADLDAAREEYKGVQRALLAKGPAVPEEQKAAVAAGIADQKAALERLGFGDALREFFNDDNGVRYSVSGEAVTDTPAFRRWFDQSKVVDANGAPLMLFHGTASDVSQFDPRKSGSKSKTGAPDGTFFLTDKVDVASSYTVEWQGDFSAKYHEGANVMPVYVSIKKPLKISAKGESWRDIPYKGEYRDINEIAQIAKESGKYDGVIISRVRDKGIGNVESKTATTYIAFQPEQIKSAFNNGDFDPENDDIRYSVDDTSAAISQLMTDKAGETTITRPDIGEITVAYGDAKHGLAHIARRRGAGFMAHLPELLSNGSIYQKPGHPDRMFIGNDSHEAVIRLDRDGQDGKWLLSAYEKHPNLAPVRQSRAERGQPFTKLSEAELHDAITTGPVGSVIARLIEHGTIVVHKSAKTLPKGAGKVPSGVQALTMPDGTMHLVAGSLGKDNARAVLLHEMFHAGTERLIGSTEWSNLMGRMGSLYRQSEQSSGRAKEFFDKARARVATAKAKGAVPSRMEVEEFAAYAIEEYERAPGSLPATIRKWVEDLIGMVKAWAVKRYGKQLGQVTPAQLSAFAKLAVMDMAIERRGEMFGPVGAMFSSSSSKTIEVDGVQRPLMNSRGQFVAKDFEAQMAFWRWFGDSRAVDAQGRPLVNYHGTTADFSEYMSNPKELGIHFGTTGQANNPLFVGMRRTGGNIMPVYLKIKNPLRVDDKFAQRAAGAAVLAMHLRDIGLMSQDQADAAIKLVDVPQSFNWTKSTKKTSQAYQLIRKAITDAGFDGLIYENNKEFVRKEPDSWDGVFEIEKVASAYTTKGREFVARFHNGSLSEPYGFGETYEDAQQDAIKKMREMGGLPTYSDSYVVFDPEQIKSAIGNTGTFDSSNPDIRYSVADDMPDASLTPPEQGLLRRVQASVQDNMNRVKQVQERIMEVTGRATLGKSDHYGAETNRPGRIAARLEDARDKMTGPLMEKLAKSGHTPEQLSELLHAMHAQERNERVAKINPEMPDGGSGMTNDQADAIIENYKSARELHALANQARTIAKATLDLKLAYGLIKAEDHNTLSTMYEHYVPLKGDGEYGPKVKRAMGHEEREEHILENIARDYDQAVVVGEKNLARQSLLQMVLQFKDDGLWTARVPPRGRYVAGKVYDVMHNGQKVASFTSQSQVSAFLEAKGAQDGAYEVQDSAGERVAEFVKPLQDNEVMVYVKGDPVRIQIHDEALARQLRPLDGGQLHPILEFMRGTNRWLSKVYTGYNPAFILKNATRDAMTGTINMVGNQGAAVAAKSWTKYPAAVKTMAQFAATKKTPNTEMGQYLTEYRMHGGKVGASYMSDLDEQGKKLSTMYDDAYGAGNYLRDGKTGKAAWIAGRKVVGGMAHVVEIANQATENALRLSLFIALREQGVSVGNAAQAAKTVTVDFDRKGASTGALSAIYLFFNPAIQGTANAMKTLVKGEHRQQAWAALGGLALLGIYAASQGMGDDKDRWLGEEWDARTKNFMLDIGGHQLRLPLSQEFAPVYALGVALAESWHGESKIRSAARMVSSFIDAYFPLRVYRDGSDNHMADLALGVTPTLVKPLTEAAFNRNSFGSQVMPENEMTKDRPDNLKMYRGTKNSVYDKTAQGIASLGELMGSGKYENDITKVSPETLKSLWRTYTGGLGTFVTDSLGLAGMALSEPGQIEGGDVPIFKDFVRPEDVKPIRGRYYDLARDAKRAITEFEQAKKAGDGEAIDKLMTEDKARLIGLGKMVRATSKAAAAIGDEKVDINADSKLTGSEKRTKLKAIEQDEERLYRSAIEAFK